MTRRAGARRGAGGIHQIATHVNDSGFARAGGGENLFRSGLAIHIRTTLRKIQIAEKSVVRTLGDEREGFFQSGGAVDVADRER